MTSTILDAASIGTKILHVFPWLAGAGDMLTAIGALVLGVLLLKGIEVPRAKLLSWNTFGLLDFVVAVSAGIALRSGYPAGTSTDAMATLPLSLIPTCIVPGYLIMHLMIYLQSREQISGH